MNDEGNTKHTLLFVVWHLHALHKLGHRPAMVTDRETIREVWERRSGLRFHYLSPRVNAGQQNSAPGDNKNEQDRSLTTTQGCACVCGACFLRAAEFFVLRLTGADKINNEQM